MSFSKRLFRDCPILAIGGTGAWMLTNSFRADRELRRGVNLSFNLGRFMRPEGANNVKPKIPLKPKPEAPQPAEIKGDNETLNTGAPPKVPEVPKEVPGPEDNPKEPGEDSELKKNLEDRGEAQDPRKLGRSDDGEGEGVLLTEEKVAADDPTQQISDVGLRCGEATTEADCEILEGGINIDKGDGKKEGYVLKSGADNGKIKFKLSDDPIYNNRFKFTITGKPITLHKKDNPSDTITLEKYESYGLEKDSNTNTIYLTRKLTAEQGMIKSLGLPDKCVLPTEVSTDVFDYKNPNSTCQIPKNQIQSINFDGKGGGRTASGGSPQLYLYIQKVGDTTTYKGGYKFFLHSDEDLNLPNGVKLAKKVWWDFRMKDPDADDLVLEKVWKNEDELLNKIGLSCKTDGTCSIKDKSLKIKIDGKVIENGRKKSGEGILYLEKNKSGYYEGLKFSLWGEKGMTIEDSSSPTSILEMKEFEEYNITKKDSNTPVFYLTRKQEAEDMIGIHLAMKPCSPDPAKPNGIQCGVNHRSLWGRFKFHDGDGEKAISSKNSNLHITVIISPDQKYPFGYRYSLEPKEDINIGKISLKAKTKTNFQIKRDVKNKKLYLEKAGK